MPSMREREQSQIKDQWSPRKSKNRRGDKQEKGHLHGQRRTQQHHRRDKEDVYYTKNRLFHKHIGDLQPMCQGNTGKAGILNVGTAEATALQLLEENGEGML